MPLIITELPKKKSVESKKAELPKFNDVPPCSFANSLGACMPEIELPMRKALKVVPFELVPLNDISKEPEKKVVIPSKCTKPDRVSPLVLVGQNVSTTKAATVIRGLLIIGIVLLLKRDGNA